MLPWLVPDLLGQCISVTGHVTRNALAARNCEEEGLGKHLLIHSRILHNIAASSETFGGKHFSYMARDEIEIMFRGFGDLIKPLPRN